MIIRRRLAGILERRRHGEHEKLLHARGEDRQNRRQHGREHPGGAQGRSALRRWVMNARPPPVHVRANHAGAFPGQLKHPGEIPDIISFPTEFQVCRDIASQFLGVGFGSIGRIIFAETREFMSAQFREDPREELHHVPIVIFAEIIGGDAHVGRNSIISRGDIVSQSGGVQVPEIGFRRQAGTFRGK